MCENQLDNFQSARKKSASVWVPIFKSAGHYDTDASGVRIWLKNVYVMLTVILQAAKYGILQLLIQALPYILCEKSGDLWNSCNFNRAQRPART